MADFTVAIEKLAQKFASKIYVYASVCGVVVVRREGGGGVCEATDSV